MRLLLDENIESGIALHLRARGHDVLYVPETFAATADSDLLALAHAQERIVVTSDLDFGELVYRRRQTAYGVLLLRLPLGTSAERLAAFDAIWSEVERRLPGHFIVATDRRLRIRAL